MQANEDHTEELDEQPKDAPRRSEGKAERRGAKPAAKQREEVGRAVGGALDRALRWLVTRHPAIYVVLFAGLAVAVFPFHQEPDQAFLDAIFGNRTVLWFARLGFMIGVAVAAFFVLRSLAAALEEGRFITAIGGVQLQEQAERRLRESSEQQRRADEEIARLTQQLEETQTLAEGLLNERDALQEQVRGLEEEKPRDSGDST